MEKTRAGPFFLFDLHPAFCQELINLSHKDTARGLQISFIAWEGRKHARLTSSERDSSRSDILHNIVDSENHVG